MTWPFGDRRTRGAVEESLERGRERRSSRGATGSVSADQAMRNSVAWACRRLRADLVSTMPLDTYRLAGGVQVEVPKPPVLIRPGGEECRWVEWTYSTQMDLDGWGNTFGVVEERDTSPQRRPMVIRLVSAAKASVRREKGRLLYLLDGKEFEAADVWHEKQYTIPGVPVGLSPIAYAALTLNTSLSAAEFASAWFGQGGRPAVHLQNQEQVLNKHEARRVKVNFVETVADGDVFVSGKDWKIDMISSKASEAQFLEQQSATNADMCRYLGVPGDMVDVSSSTGSITYANVTQRNLQFLIMNLNPTLVRREDAFTYFLLPAPRYAKFARGALLQMDLKTRYEAHKLGIDGRFLTVDEARELEDRAPLTDEDLAQFAALWPKSTTPIPTAVPGGTP